MYTIESILERFTQFFGFPQWRYPNTSGEDSDCPPLGADQYHFVEHLHADIFTLLAALQIFCYGESDYPTLKVLPSTLRSP